MELRETGQVTPCKPRGRKSGGTADPRLVGAPCSPSCGAAEHLCRIAISSCLSPPWQNWNFSLLSNGTAVGVADQVDAAGTSPGPPVCTTACTPPPCPGTSPSWFIHHESWFVSGCKQPPSSRARGSTLKGWAQSAPLTTAASPLPGQEADDSLGLHQALEGSPGTQHRLPGGASWDHRGRVGVWSAAWAMPGEWSLHIRVRVRSLQGDLLGVPSPWTLRKKPMAGRVGVGLRKKGS